MKKEEKEIPKKHGVSFQEILQEEEREKEQKIVNLITKIIVRTTLDEFYETGNSVS